MSEVSVGCSFL